MLLRVLKSLNQDEDWLFVLQLYFYELAVMKTHRRRPDCRQNETFEITFTTLDIKQGSAHKQSLE